MIEMGMVSVMNIEEKKWECDWSVGLVGWCTKRLYKTGVCVRLLNRYHIVLCFLGFVFFCDWCLAVVCVLSECCSVSMWHAWVRVCACVDAQSSRIFFFSMMICGDVSFEINQHYSTCVTRLLYTCLVFAAIFAIFTLAFTPVSTRRRHPHLISIDPILSSPSILPCSKRIVYCLVLILLWIPN
ncbi:hypothetical protein BD289DRAFT_184565 [Coniella lustricola]|uniref:Transmembrane protein n=1 Tax=Coniella lustricola TaxID=2025994 RepID=A0A2T3ADA9_9PEZI|nr:hypothetical protein BD289DRAFT_184565 [Coniella lustricola]